MIDTTDLRLWHHIEILEILRRHDKPQSPSPNKSTPRSDYGSNAVEVFIASGLVVADHSGYLHPNPTVTEEQWDGVRVQKSLLAEEALSDSVELTSKQFRTFVRLVAEHDAVET